MKKKRRVVFPALKKFTACGGDKPGSISQLESCVDSWDCACGGRLPGPLGDPELLELLVSLMEDTGSVRMGQTWRRCLNYRRPSSSDLSPPIGFYQPGSV